MRRLYLYLRIVSLSLALLCASPMFADDLDTLFRNPPQSARPGVWWHWMGCNVTREGITRDLEAFKSVGISSATIFGMADATTPWAAHIENSPNDGLIAFTEPWWKLVKFAASEGKRLGIDVGLHNCPGYTSTGGPWITPELSMQQIFQSETAVEGGKPFDGVLPRPTIDPRAQMAFPVVNKETGALEKPVIPARATYWRDIAVLAVPAEGVIAKESIVDLTAQMDASGRVRWNPPAGKWLIYRFGHTSMGSLTQPNQWEAMGLECDKMSETAVRFHLSRVIGDLKRNLGPLVGTGLKHILLDSYEAGTPSWTPRMPQEFAARRGYDLKTFLPTFAKRVVVSEEASKKFKADFGRTISDLYRDILFPVMEQMLRAEKLQFVCEPYGGPFRTEEVTPYVHRVMTEFWNRGRFENAPMNGIFNAGPNKLHNILEAEAFTGSPGNSKFDETPGKLKATGDGAFCAGINRFVLHTNPLQPWNEGVRPGMTMGQWGTHFGRTQTWWEPGKAWFAYLGRCQALLQWGRTQAGGVVANGLDVQAIQRTDGKSRLFFLAHGGAGGDALCRFAVTGMQPELWDPVLGTKRDLADFVVSGGETIVPLRFAPKQSWIVVFRRKLSQNTIKPTTGNFPTRTALSELSGTWKVRFDPKWGGPAEQTFSALTDWAKHTEPGIKYYSGTATYRKIFDADPTKSGWLDLGVVYDMAVVRLNGKALGTLWTAPFGVAIPAGLLRPTGNVLEIEVTNVWANRMIGDEQEPADAVYTPGFMGNGGYLKRFPDWFVKNTPRPSRGRYTFATWNYFTKDSPLVPSGLIGPVRLMAETPAAPAPKEVVAAPQKAFRTGSSIDVSGAPVVKISVKSVNEENPAHPGGGQDASALFNGTTQNGARTNETRDDGKTFRGYGNGSRLTIDFGSPREISALYTYAAHPDARASQSYRVLVAQASAPKSFREVGKVSGVCEGGASVALVNVNLPNVTAIRFEFSDGPMGFCVYREIEIMAAARVPSNR